MASPALARCCGGGVAAAPAAAPASAGRAHGHRGSVQGGHAAYSGTHQAHAHQAHAHRGWSYGQRLSGQHVSGQRISGPRILQIAGVPNATPLAPYDAEASRPVIYRIEAVRGRQGAGAVRSNGAGAKIVTIRAPRG